MNTSFLYKHEILVQVHIDIGRLVNVEQHRYTSKEKLIS